MGTAASRTAALALALSFALVACGRERPDDVPAAGTAPTETGAFEDVEAEPPLAGRVVADGSSTVAPLVTLAAERFRAEEPDVQVTVGVSGTGGGFERFCAGETDLATASRPVEDEEADACARKRVAFRELHVANDGLSVVVNRENTWADCLTVDQLKRIWEPGSDVDSWDDVDRAFPDEELTLFGPGTDSGTFDYFTGEIVGEEGSSRSDYSPSENDNVIVRGVAGTKGGLGYLGLSFVEQNRAKLRAVSIDGGDGCVPPSARTVQNATYRPLSRPLYVYAKTSALARPEVNSFVRFLVDNSASLARGAQFVPLTEAQLERTQSELDRRSTR